MTHQKQNEIEDRVKVLLIEAFGEFGAEVAMSGHSKDLSHITEKYHKKR